MHTLKFILHNCKPYKKYLFGMLFAMCLIVLNDTIKPFLVKQLIDTVSGKAPYNLWRICVSFGCLSLMANGAWVFYDYCLVSYMTRFRLNTIEYFMRRLYLYPYTFFQNQLAGSLASKLGDIFQMIPKLIFTTVHHFWYFCLLLIVSVFLLSRVHKVFAITMVVWVFFFFMATFIFSVKKGMYLTRSYGEEKAKVLGLTSDYLSNMLSVKTFATRDFELSRFAKLKEGFLEVAHKQGFYFVYFYAVQGFFTGLYSTCFIIFLILEYKVGLVSPGDFALVVMINFNVISHVYQLSHHLRDFIEQFGSVVQALSILEDVPDIQDKHDAKDLKVTKGLIVFDRVNFYYKGTEELFQNKSVTIGAGEKIGLVGYSGSGKSTFVNLILRLYDVTSGHILIDGQNICDVTQDSLHRNISMIPQDPSLFHRTLMENIRYGLVTASDEEVINAAKRAHAHDFIVGLPQGYDSLVGERGIRLSGGQRQRIAIARAVLKNAPILILDEATSQLDSVTERIIQKSLWELMQGKTTIVIAHRLSTLLRMDRILVFDQGKIVEDGTHSKLLAKGGLYKTLWDSQIGGFLPDKKEGEDSYED